MPEIDFRTVRRGVRPVRAPRSEYRKGVGRPALPHGHLARRQVVMLQMIADGATDKQVAERMGWSVRTAEKEAALIRAALDASSRANAVAIGIRRGLIS